MAGSLHLPVVDLALPDLRAAAESIRQVTPLDPQAPEKQHPERMRLRAYLVAQACVEHGFFYVTNHGVDRGLLEAVFAESKRFFDLPMEDKMALLRGANHRGYTPPYAEKLDASSQFVGDLKESFYIGPLDDGDMHNDVNQWPSEERLPSWKETMKLYFAAVLDTGTRILSLVALGLDLDADFFHKIGALKCPSTFLRLLHYPGEVHESDSGNYGASAHSDYGMITLLVTDGTPGLQVCYRFSKSSVHHCLVLFSFVANRSWIISCHPQRNMCSCLEIQNNVFIYCHVYPYIMAPYAISVQICREKDRNPQLWEDVHHIDGALIINIGDLLERWTNCAFRWLSFLIQILTHWCSVWKVVAVKHVHQGFHLSRVGTT
uniref:Non-haem dioxygenase N-terminal domain-containing protein n=1 Tax=Zea mays TaxID=4577 RepID=A0A804RBG8_MAIZE